MKKQIKGTFDIKVTQLPPDEVSRELGAMKMVFHKTFHGELAGTSVVEMLGILDKERGSGAYVAMERLTVTLEGKKGAFCLFHSSSMLRGKQTQNVLVVPESGTDALAGLSGAMTIEIVEGKHYYTFEYEL